MASIKKDIKLKEEKFKQAQTDMHTLADDTEKFKKEIEKQYDTFINALKCESGKEFKHAATSVILEPIYNLSLVIKQMSDTLDTVIGSGYYNDIFTAFLNLKNSI